MIRGHVMLNVYVRSPKNLENPDGVLALSRGSLRQ